VLEELGFLRPYGYRVRDITKIKVVGKRGCLHEATYLIT
jgi:hypothetical protein